MHRILSCLAVVLLIRATPVQAQDKPVRDLWDVAYLEGQKAGFFHTTVHEIEREGKKYLRSTVELNLSIKRFNSVANIRMSTGTEETPGGRVTSISLRQYLDKDHQLNLTGTVEGENLHIKSPEAGSDKKIAWNADVIGMHRQLMIYQERAVKPGEQFSYLSYESTILTPVLIRSFIKPAEEVEILGVRKKLLRVDAVPDKVEVQGQTIKLPSMSLWLDKEYLPERSQLEMPGIGKIVLYRTTREVATAEVLAAVAVPDLGLTTLVPLNRRIENPHATASAVYRITLKGDDDPATAFAQDSRQQIKNVKGNTFDLQVRSVRVATGEPKGVSPRVDYLKSCYFLNSDDPDVKALTAKAMGTETDPWKKAQLIEKWVHDNMHMNNGIAFTTAGEVARGLQGDCRQHAMLTAAMCRSAGIPSRTAVGLVYVPDADRGPVMGFHMWTEVWVRGQWIAIDATLGKGSIGAAHIKISDHSWFDTETLTPLLPVARVLGKMTIEVVSVTAGE